MYRQGDVLLVKIDKLPKRLKEKNKVIAVGEATGHSHRFEDKTVTVFEDLNKQQFVKADTETVLLHEEHKPLTVEKGFYKVVLQREYDIQEGVRQVMD